MMDYKLYPPIPSAPPAAPPLVGSREWGPSGTYHLSVITAKRQELIAKKKMFEKKYKKYNKI